MKHNLLYVLILIITITACNKKKSITEEHDHSNVKLQFIEYSDYFELFAESDPFVKGESTTILAHFTQLNNFKPLKEGIINLQLITGDKIVEDVVNEPVKPGIYEFVLKPEKNGASKLIFNIKSKEVNYQIQINNVVVYNDEHTAVHIAEKKIIDNINAINFTKEQSWKIDFATILPSVESFGKVIKSTAQILPFQSNETFVIAKTNGVVKLHGNILEGTVVNNEDDLFSISGNGLANDNAEVRYLEAKNNYDLAKADFDRKKALYQNKIVSEKELESAKADFQNAKAVFNNLKNNFSANGQIVTSPMKGTVKHVYVTNGQYVEAGEALFSVVDNSKLIVKAEVQQKYYPYLSSISSINIKSSINNKIYSLNELNGKLLSYGKNIDEDEGYLIPINFQIENNERFLTGSFVEVFIKTISNKKALIVPNTALIEEQGNFFVFVQLTPELFEKREVKTGVSDGKNTEVITGLNDQERIVSKGAIIIKLAAVSNSLDPHAGHVH